MSKMRPESPIYGQQASQDAKRKPKPTPNFSKMENSAESYAGDAGISERRALAVLPGGASHDARQLSPLSFVAAHAYGAEKTGMDGRCVVDLQCGNGSLILGHGHPVVLTACEAALKEGLNFSATSEREILWAETVCALMPGIQKVRFTASGNEACMLAFAIARERTGRSPVLTLRGHYCGWIAPASMPCTALELDDGLQGTLPGHALVTATTPQAACEALSSKQFAALIIEPTGGSFGKYPLGAEWVSELAAAAHESGTICIFDETITGFRVAPGGAQSLLNVQPDLTVLGKILGGGLPCGAIAGKDEILAPLDNRISQSQQPGVSHMGTGNGSPLVAAAGTATLNAIADGKAGEAAEMAAEAIRAAFNNVLDEAGIPWRAYGQHSAVHLFLNPYDRSLRDFDPATISFEEASAKSPVLINDLRVACLHHGLDINGWPGGTVSAVHQAADIQKAASAFSSALQDLREAGHALTGWGRA